MNITNDNLNKLESEIILSEEGGIYFAEYDDKSNKNEILKRLKEKLESKSIKVIELEIDESKYDLAEVLRFQAKKFGTTRIVFFVFPPSDKKLLEKFAGIWNYTREKFRSIKHPIVIWGDEPTITTIAKIAPDFWAWRNRVFEFKSRNEKLINLYKDMLKKLKERKDYKKVAEIKEILNNYEGI